MQIPVQDPSASNISIRHLAVIEALHRTAVVVEHASCLDQTWSKIRHIGQAA